MSSKDQRNTGNMEGELTRITSDDSLAWLTNSDPSVLTEKLRTYQIWIRKIAEMSVENEAYEPSNPKEPQI